MVEATGVTEKKVPEKYSVAVDLDGVLAQYDGWKGLEHIGPPIPGAQEFIQKLIDMGYQVLIHTTRTSTEVNDAELEKLERAGKVGPYAAVARSFLLPRISAWWKQHGFPPLSKGSCEIHDGSKPLALAYIDDRAIRCVPQAVPTAYATTLRMAKEALEKATTPVCPLSDETVERIAERCHGANRAWCQTHGDTSQPEWKDAPDWQKRSAVAGVKAVLIDPTITPEDSHHKWRMRKLREGWIYGPTKHVERKEHPCMLPYHSLPADQRSKDEIFINTVLMAIKPLTAAAAGTPNRRGDLLRVGELLSELVPDATPAQDGQIRQIARILDRFAELAGTADAEALLKSTNPPKTPIPEDLQDERPEGHDDERDSGRAGLAAGENSSRNEDLQAQAPEPREKPQDGREDESLAQRGREAGEADSSSQGGDVGRPGHSNDPLGSASLDLNE